MVTFLHLSTFYREFEKVREVHMMKLTMISSRNLVKVLLSIGRNFCEKMNFGGSAPGDPQNVTFAPRALETSSFH